MFPPLFSLQMTLHTDCPHSPRLTPLLCLAYRYTMNETKQLFVRNLLNVLTTNLQAYFITHFPSSLSEHHLSYNYNTTQYSVFQTACPRNMLCSFAILAGHLCNASLPHKGRGSAVGIATDHIVQTGSVAHPASHPKCTVGSSPGVKRKRHEANQSPRNSAEVN
jgi:hypothetical protein